MSAVAHTQLAERRHAGLDELLLSARSNLIGNPRHALSATNDAVTLADTRGDPESQAAARHLRGEAHRILGQHEAALRDYAEASRAYRRLGRPGDAARSDASAVDSLRCLGRSTEALRLATSARRVFRHLGEELRSAVLDEMVGLVAWIGQLPMKPCTTPNGPSRARLLSASPAQSIWRSTRR